VLEAAKSLENWLKGADEVFDSSEAKAIVIR
jgi:hypothetical protein